MVLFDVGITHGSYWKGGQIPYWLYLVFVILFGFLGWDHLLLRSPTTAILKFLSLVPLLGFWYFYDIAQAIGERDKVEKYGIGVPFYGPIGLGAGMFINKDKKNISSPDIPKPWIFMLYVLTTLVFIAFPLNKIVIGDYWGCLMQISMYTWMAITTLGISLLIGFAWGIYDIYNVIFKTRDILENGIPRIPPATWIGLDARFKRDALGPGKPLPPQEPTTLIGKTVKAVSEIPMNAANAVSTITKAYGNTTASLINVSGGVAKGVIEATEGVTVGLVREGVKDATDVMKKSTQTATGIIEKSKSATENVIGATADTVVKTAEASKALLQVATKMPSILDKVEKASITLPSQKGGGLELFESTPSGTSVALLFSVGLLAFGGYVLYMARTLFSESRNDRKDDSPPDPGAIRKSSQAGTR
jgi:hypothetical protein